MSRGRGGWYPPPARPRSVDGGLKPRSARGAIGQTWWSERFVSVLERIGLGSRLQRGRNYARRGQVISLDIDAGLVSAQVQGSRSRPYRVRIGITAFGKAEWAALERALAASAWYAARLLAGEMPQDIEDVFAATGLSLFPASPAELSMDCSCPDSQVPCKHIAAVFYLLAEMFDDDPFAILAWRGREREDLLANLHAARPDGQSAADQRERTGPRLEDCVDAYFEMPTKPPMTSPAVTAIDAVLGQLPPVSIALGGRPLTDLLRPAYEAFAIPVDNGLTVPDQ
ncbi:MAG: SWIM zinc finger family protein [Streptosporangiaceae bacterium]